jgi:hypothetical protein
MEKPNTFSDFQKSLQEELRFKAQKLFMQRLFRDRLLNLNERVRQLTEDFLDIVGEPNILGLYRSVLYDEEARQNGEDTYWDYQNISQERAKEYFERLLKDIPRRLRPEYGVYWVLEMLHSCVVTADLGIKSYPMPWVGEKSIGCIKLHLDIEIDIYPQTRRAEVKQWANEQVEKQIDQQWERIEANPAYIQRVKRPEDWDIEQKVEWLYRCLLKDYKGRGIPRVSPGDGRDYIPHDVADSIRHTAKLLGIKVRCGRPSKAEKR